MPKPPMMAFSSTVTMRLIELAKPTISSESSGLAKRALTTVASIPFEASSVAASRAGATVAPMANIVTSSPYLIVSPLPMGISCSSVSNSTPSPGLRGYLTAIGWRDFTAV